MLDQSNAPLSLFLFYQSYVNEDEQQEEKTEDVVAKKAPGNKTVCVCVCFVCDVCWCIHSVTCDCG